MIVTPYPNEKEINKTTCSLYPFGFFFGTNIIIYRILVYFTLCNPTTVLVTNLDLPTTYNVLHDKTQPNVSVNDKMCCECNKLKSWNTESINIVF